MVLDYFKSRQAILSQMRCGAKLRASNTLLTIEQGGKVHNVAKLSQVCRKQMESHRAKGYYPVDATASLLVHWKGKEDEQETIIILPCSGWKRRNHRETKSNRTTTIQK